MGLVDELNHLKVSRMVQTVDVLLKKKRSVMKDSLRELIREELLMSFQNMSVNDLFLFFQNQNEELVEEYDEKILEEIFREEYFKVLESLKEL